MERGERRNKTQLKMVVNRRTNEVKQQMRQVSGKKNGRLPLGQLQTHAAHPYSLVGGKNPRQEDGKQLGKVRSQVDVGCQTLPDEDYKMCTEDQPSEKYWELLAERRRVALANTLEENRELHKKIEKLYGVDKDLEQQRSDTKFYAMMYCISRKT
ncbi:uncharacterized protein [Dysidea avara]|uniref:uncharacterized protein isoform X1 n=1 Tax=Dysidea avara TaxID=196820 RepID=UPI00333047C3